MRITNALWRQHLDFMFKKHWRVQGKRVPIDTGAEAHLKSLNIPVVDALEFTKPKPEQHPKVDIVGLYDKPPRRDANHPDYKAQPCYTLKSNNVLLVGISQAQVLTKTIIVENKLPSKIEEIALLEMPTMIQNGVKKAILSGNIFDCEQEKLPKIKDPVRPAFNFPRILGITDKRRNIIITNKLLQLIEKSCDTETVLSRFVLNNVDHRFTFGKEDDLLQFQTTSHILVTSDKPLKHDISAKNSYTEIPNLYPIKQNITMAPSHFYENDSRYAIKSNVHYRHPHTTWLHYNKSEVRNLFEEPVTNEQILGRSLTNAFTVAASYAKQLHGEDVKELPEPIYINSIQTDGQEFHFGVLELNTLDLNGTQGVKNVWYSKNNMKLYGSCKYLNSIPALEKYNPLVFSYINAMYNC